MKTYTRIKRRFISGCAIYGHKNKDGNVVITDIKYFNHEHN